MYHFYYNLLQIIVFGKRYITIYKVTMVSNILVEKNLDSLNENFKLGSV